MNSSGLILLALIAIILAWVYQKFGTKHLRLPGRRKNFWAIVIIIVLLIALFYGAQSTPHAPVG